MKPAVLLALAAIALAAAPVAAADASSEKALAERYAPVVRLVAHSGECGPGKPYVPIDVDALFGEPTVALRGPWGGGDLVKIAPDGGGPRGAASTSTTSTSRGTRSSPGCDYLQWERRLTAGRAPTVYAHVATDPGIPESSRCSTGSSTSSTTGTTSTRATGR